MNKEWFSDYKEQISLNNMQEARNVILDNIDKTKMIYRYSRGLNRDLQNLENHQLWLSSAFNFNDPYDCLVTVDCGLKAGYPKSQRKEAMETYMRQENENRETVAENNNNRMLHSKKENEMYADLDEILQWAENNYIDVYMPIISRKEYKMMDRALRLI